MATFDEDGRLVHTTANDEDFVLLHAYSERVYAEMVIAALEEAGIPAMLKSNELFGLPSGMGSGEAVKVEVWVAATQHNAAIELADGLADHL